MCLWTAATLEQLRGLARRLRLYTVENHSCTEDQDQDQAGGQCLNCFVRSPQASAGRNDTKWLCSSDGPPAHSSKSRCCLCFALLLFALVSLGGLGLVSSADAVRIQWHVVLSYLVRGERARAHSYYSARRYRSCSFNILAVQSLLYQCIKVGLSL